MCNAKSITCNERGRALFSQYFKVHQLQNVSLIERIIIQEILGAANARFLHVSVFDGKKMALKSCANFREVERFIGRTDETTLHFSNSQGDVVGFVVLAHGKDAGVIAHVSDEPEIQKLLTSAKGVAAQFLEPQSKSEVKQAKSEVKQASMTFRLEADLQAAFLAACKAADRSAAQELRAFMRSYVDRSDKGGK